MAGISQHFCRAIASGLRSSGSAGCKSLFAKIGSHGGTLEVFCSRHAFQGSVSTMAKVLENRCAIVTGASQGLGFEIARKYLQAGANLMICARGEMLLDEAALKLKKLAGTGQSVLALPADVSKPADVAALVDGALREFGRLDILVNNAGVAGPNGAIENIDWKD